MAAFCAAAFAIASSATASVSSRVLPDKTFAKAIFIVDIWRVSVSSIRGSGPWRIDATDVMTAALLDYGQ